jgi:uncharacterized integral membrane protein
MTQTPNEPGRVPVQPPTERRRVGRGGATPSRVGSLWVASVLFAVVLLLLLIFVLQNGQSAKISYLGAHGSVPQGVALLLAAVFGILLVALPGTARIIQLRIRERRHRDARPIPPPVPAGPTGVAGSVPGIGSTAAPVDASPTPATPRHAAEPSTSTPAANAPAGNAPAGNAGAIDAPAGNAPTTPVATPAQPPPADPR